ncbi:MAG: PilZ domain-containing protein [Bdellovibrio sp.]|nr:PilZ domain-containing protein [Bdellovibrio sp.]
MSPLVVFKNIGSASEKKSLFERLTSEEGEIVLKGKQDQSFIVTAISLGENQIQCITPEGVSMKFGLKEVVTANFTVGGEKYLFEAYVMNFEGGANLTVLNLFHLQRRKNFRYTIPTNYAADFCVTTLNSRSTKISCRLLDLSTEGCAILMTPDMASLKQEDRIEAAIFLGERDPILVQGFVKNLRARGDDLILGVEFNHLANASEHAITSAITEMQREIYLRKTA